jgi:hypothetical protein
MTFGEKAVGFLFDPSGGDAVSACRRQFAAAIDLMNDFRTTPGRSSEEKRLASVAITEAQTAQMWAEKALTWKD